MKTAAKQAHARGLASGQTIGLRPEGEVMEPPRLGALAPSLLSFSRSLMRRMIAGRWLIERRVFDIDHEGAGEAIYRIEADDRVFEFVIFAFRPAPDTVRTDRIIGTEWDVMAALLEGEATQERIALTRRELPKLYAGRAAPGTLVWCRANRSARIFEHVVDSLAAGRQPDPKALADVCYLLRNTGLDANGTFGTPSFLSYGDEHPLRLPYHAQMLAAYIMREFGCDLADSLARRRGPRAEMLRPEFRRFIGLGNSSGLGLVLFCHNHPRLLSRWIELRERCLARAKKATLGHRAPDVTRLSRLLDRCIRFHAEDGFEYRAFTPSATIAGDLRVARDLVEEFAATGTVAGIPTLTPWVAICDALIDRVDPGSLEQLHALLIDLDPEYVDSVNPEHVVSELIDYAPEMSIRDLREILEKQYAWALAMDLEREGAYRYFWYKSAEAEEPRRGTRGGPVGGFNLGTDTPGDVQRLYRAVARCSGDLTVGAFLRLEPTQRDATRRVQGLRNLRYHSPHANTMSDEFVPAHLIRLVNASFYGLDKTRDVEFSLNRWVRGVMFHGAPAAGEISAGAERDWEFPPRPAP